MHATDDIVTVIIIIMHGITIYDWMHVAGECTDNVQYYVYMHEIQYMLEYCSWTATAAINCY